jgi:chorismate mutase/prephenate dehydratase
LPNAPVSRSRSASQKQGAPATGFYRPEREAEVLRGVVARNKGPLRDEEILRLFREIMSACLAQEEPLKVGYLGPEGTFTPVGGIQALRPFGARPAAGHDR